MSIDQRPRGSLGRLVSRTTTHRPEPILKVQYLAVVPLLSRSLEGVCIPLSWTQSSGVKRSFLLAVAVWAVLSLFIHLTFVPRLMVMWAGLKRKFWIKTFLVGCFCAMAAVG